MFRRARGPLLLLVVSSLAFASSVRPRDLAERARDADRVVFAEILGAQVETPGGDVHRLTTVTSLVVLEDYKGHGPRMLKVTQLGGQSGLWKLSVSGQAELVPGEMAVLFLRCPDGAHPERCTLDGLAEAKATVVGPVGRQDVLVSSVRGGPTRMRLEDLADRVRDALAKSGGAQ